MAGKKSYSLHRMPPLSAIVYHPWSFTMACTGSCALQSVTAALSAKIIPPEGSGMMFAVVENQCLWSPSRR